MPKVTQAAKELALDECLELLLHDEDWTPALPEEETARMEMNGLMAVAQRLFELARRSPRLDPGSRRRMWQRWLHITLEVTLLGRQPFSVSGHVT